MTKISFQSLPIRPLSARVLSTVALCVLSAQTAHAQDDKNLKVGGRVQMDYTLADVTKPDSTISKAWLRRARLNVSGKYGDTIKYKFEINTDSSGDIVAKDAYLQFSPKSLNASFKVGQFKTDNSLDEQTSSRFISTVKRATFTDAFAFDRRVGLSIGTKGERYTLNAGVFGENLESDEQGYRKDGYAIAGRATYNRPFEGSDTLIHLGTSYRYRAGAKNDSNGNDEAFKYANRPFTHDSDKILATPAFAKSDQFFGVEAAALRGPFWMAAEYGHLGTQAISGFKDKNFNGYYGEAGMMLGGKRTYKGGKFQRPQIESPINDGGWGALAFVARYDRMDLKIMNLDAFILGADWYPTSHSRISLNLFQSDAQNGAADKATGLVSRVQFDF